MSSTRTSGPRPHAQVWTDGRVEEWKRTGEHPSVAVWTAKQLSTFLAGVVEDSLFAFWWLAALRGLRRGELCGLRWAAVDLDRGLLFVERQRATAGHEIVEGDPKTAAGCRAVALDKHTVAILREHRRRQVERGDRRSAANMAWDDSGYVFTRKDGQPINPNYATTRFRKLTERAGLPPVRLHDLRNGAASLAHEAGADLKTLQDLLGHSSIVVTADTYTSVLPDAQRRCADATAALVRAAARHTRKLIKQKAAKNRPAARDENKPPWESSPIRPTRVITVEVSGRQLIVDLERIPGDQRRRLVPPAQRLHPAIPHRHRRQRLPHSHAGLARPSRPRTCSGTGITAEPG